MKTPKRMTEKFTFKFKTTRRGYGDLMGIIHHQFDILGVQNRVLKGVYNQLKKQFKP